MRIAGVVLVAALIAAAANALVVGPEVPVTPPQYGPAPAIALQVFPTVASDGSDYLVAWNNHAAIVSSAGEVKSIPQRTLFPDDVIINNAVWNGSSWLVAGYSSAQRSVVVTRVASDGTLIDAPHAVAAASGMPQFRSLAWNGRDYLLQFLTVRGGPEALLLSPSGDVIRPVVLPLYGAVVVVGDTFYIFGGLKVIRVNAAGDVFEGSPVTVGVAPHMTAFDVATNGRTIVVAANEGNAVQTFAVDPATLQSTAWPPVPAPRSFIISIVSNGSTFLVSSAFGGLGFLQMLPLNADGSPAATTAPPCCGNSAGFASIASNGSAFFAAWLANGEIAGSIFHIDGSEAGERIVSISAGEQLQPAMAGSLLVWHEANAMHAVRMGVNGAVGDPVIVWQSPSQSDVAVTFTGSLYFIAWTEEAGSRDNAHVVMRRFRTDLTPIDPAPVPMAPAPSRTPALTTDGTHALAVWAQDRSIRAVRLPDFGPVIDTPATLDSSLSFTPHVAWNGGEYLVVWTHGFHCDQICVVPPPHVVGVRLAADGSPLHAAPIVIATTPFTEQYALAVAPNGRDFGVGYDTVDSSAFEIRQRATFRHVDSNGILGPEVTPGSVPYGPLPTVAIARRGEGYVVAYENHNDFHLAHFDDAISGDIVFATSPTFGEFALDASLIAYTRFADEPQYGGVRRLFTRTVASEPRVRQVRR